jgi:CRISPR-associated protein Csb1
MQLAEIIQDQDTVAITMSRQLAALDGKDVPIFPPTYPAEKNTKRHRFDTPYTINERKDGTLVADLDSVQSQANRMEAAFAHGYAEQVPQHSVRAGETELKLVELPHRLVDAVARATDLRAQIAAAMNAYDAGEPGTVAALCPTALVYGAWDSRDTGVKIPRAVRSEIRAFDVTVATRSAQFTGSFAQPELGLTKNEWEKGAELGFAPTPSVNAHGGVYVNGQILHTASIVLAPLRRGTDPKLPPYLLGLAVCGLLYAMRETRLRVGCELLPAGTPQWQRVRADGSRTNLDVSDTDIDRQLKAAASDWASTAGVKLGLPAAPHQFDPTAAKQAIKAATTDKTKTSAGE